jgi:hypothetical protein
VVAIAASLAVATASTARAAPPVPVSIHLFPTAFCCPEVGTWEATGGISDSGSYERTGGHTTGSLPDCFCGTIEHTGAFKEVFLLTSSRGTITVRDEEQLTPTADGSFPPSTGVWQIASGTGAYDRASGHGTSQFSFGPPFDLALTGLISETD